MRTLRVTSSGCGAFLSIGRGHGLGQFFQGTQPPAHNLFLCWSLMPLSAGSSSQAPCGWDLSTPPSLPHTPVRHAFLQRYPILPRFRPRDPGEYSNGSGGVGRRIQLVGGFRHKSRSGENVPSPSPSRFSSKPPHKLCSSPCTL